MVTVHTRVVPRGSFGERPCRWGPYRPTLGDCLTCTVTLGNGSRTAGTNPMPGHPRMGPRGKAVTADGVYIEVVVGKITRRMCARRCATPKDRLLVAKPMASASPEHCRFASAVPARFHTAFQRSSVMVHWWFVVAQCPGQWFRIKAVVDNLESGAILIADEQ